MPAEGISPSGDLFSPKPGEGQASYVHLASVVAEPTRTIAGGASTPKTKPDRSQLLAVVCAWLVGRATAGRVTTPEDLLLSFMAVASGVADLRGTAILSDASSRAAKMAVGAVPPTRADFEAAIVALSQAET